MSRKPSRKRNSKKKNEGMTAVTDVLKAFEQKQKERDNKARIGSDMTVVIGEHEKSMAQSMVENMQQLQRTANTNIHNVIATQDSVDDMDNGHFFKGSMTSFESQK